LLHICRVKRHIYPFFSCKNGILIFFIMRIGLGFILSPFFYLIFGFWLLVFHPIQWFCYRIFGYKGHKISVDMLNFFLTYSSLLLFNLPILRKRVALPTNRPLIFVSNHQSTFDIPGLIYFFRRYHGKFISKIELAQSRIPSIAFNLKHGGGANINRKDKTQSTGAIRLLGQRMHTNKWSAFIFPEGTRSKDGHMKSFQVGGIATLISACPDALIVPVAIRGSFDMVKTGMFPLIPFNKMIWELLPPIEIQKRPIEQVVWQAEQAIRKIVERQ